MEKEEANERRQTKGVARDGASPARRRKQREECGVTSLMSYKNVISASVSSHPPTDLRVLLAYRGGRVGFQDGNILFQEDIQEAKEEDVSKEEIFG